MLSEGRRSLHQAIESTMVTSFSRFLRSSSRCSNRSSWRPSVHEAASTTTGNFPPSLQRHSASLICSDIHVCPRLYPLELHGVEQHRPLTSSGIQRGLPARAERATNVSGRAGDAGLVLSLPKMRLMHAGKYAAAAPSRLVFGRSAGAACGSGPATVGIISLLIRMRATSARRSTRYSLHDIGRFDAITRRLLCFGTLPGHVERHLFSRHGVFHLSEVFDQGPGIDSNRTDVGAGSVDSAG